MYDSANSSTHIQTVYRAITVGKGGKLIERDQPKIDSFMTLNRDGSLVKKSFVKEVSIITTLYRGRQIVSCNTRKVA